MMATAPFIVFSLPRSRSAWLTHFLSRPPKRVGHDMVLHCDTVKQFIELFSSGMDGTCETASVLGHRLIKHLIPQIRFAVVKRPLPEVGLSLSRLGLLAPPGELESRQALMEQVEGMPGTLVLDFDWLASPDWCRRLWDFCHPDAEFDLEWWEHCSRFNIQVEMQGQMDLLRERAPAMVRLRQEIIDLSGELGCQGLN